MRLELAGHALGHRQGRVRVQRRLGEVDEADADGLGERGREVLLGYEAFTAQHRGQGLSGAAGVRHGDREVVA